MKWDKVSAVIQEVFAERIRDRKVKNKGMKKYILTSATKKISFSSKTVILHRIQAVTAFGTVKAGDFGGWIEKEENLSHEGEAWIYGNAQVFGDAQIYEDAMIYGRKTKVYGRAKIYGDAQVCNNAQVY
ncbi:MAG: hypothetical protein Q4C66_06365, partial [Lachnospiraceae bacterium]|nr:hypothetical protein [Lachnospiraceae bacterium]